MEVDKGGLKIKQNKTQQEKLRERSFRVSE